MISCVYTVEPDCLNHVLIVVSLLSCTKSVKSKSLYLVIIDINVIFKSHLFVMENAMNVIEMYSHILYYIKLVVSFVICLMCLVNI